MAVVLTSAGCGDDAEPCLTYACTSGAGIEASVPCSEAMADFVVTLCHGDECSTDDIAWSRENEQDCTDSLAPDLGPSGGDVIRYVCAKAEGQNIVFSGFWDLGDEGVPARKAFRLRIADRTTGEVLLDESANGDFEPSRVDNCHSCYGATIDLGASSGECSAPP